jgi:hypothetical protein
MDCNRTPASRACLRSLTAKDVVASLDWLLGCACRVQPHAGAEPIVSVMRGPGIGNRKAESDAIPAADVRHCRSFGRGPAASGVRTVVTLCRPPGAGCAVRRARARQDGSLGFAPQAGCGAFRPRAAAMTVPPGQALVRVERGDPMLDGHFSWIEPWPCVLRSEVEA